LNPREEKEAKRLLSICLRGPIPISRGFGPRTHGQKLFASFSRKRRVFFNS
jgi:hypothetical protein